MLESFRAGAKSFSAHVGLRDTGLLELVVLRLVVVAVVLGLALVLEGHFSALDLGSLAPALAFGTISIVASWWLPLGLLDLALVTALFYSTSGPEFAETRRGAFLLQVNRLVGHTEALLTWLAVLLASISTFHYQMLAAALLVAFGALSLDALGWFFLGRPGRLYEDNRHFARRPFVLGAALLGMVLVWIVGRDDITPLVPLTGVLLGDLLARGVWMVSVTKLKRCDRFRVHAWASSVDRLAGLCLLMAVAAVPLWLSSGIGLRVAKDHAQRGQAWKNCQTEPSSPAIGGIFMIADNQFHDLTAKVGGFQSTVLDSIVHVARRPPALDALSSATLAEFARQYRSILAEHPGLPWAHLGDVGDLGCASEVSRLGRLIDRFDRDLFAGFTPGNHDSSYVGNLTWHPEWHRACPAGRAEHDALAGLAQPPLARVDGAGYPTIARSGPHSEFHATISDLSFARDRSILGVFLDTTDYGWLKLGLTGVQGSLSRGQLKWVEQQVAPYASAQLLVFLHHPRDALSPWGAYYIDGFIRRHHEQLLAIIAAHTHLAADRTPRTPDGMPSPGEIPELIVGSTTDPPQEAALILVRGKSGGPLQLSYRTTAAVARRGATCDEPLGIDGDVCAARLEMIAADARLAACKPLLQDQSDPNVVANVAQSCLWGVHQSPTSIHDFAAALDRLPLGETDRLETAACLSWVGSVVQGKKNESWSFSAAWQLALDPAATAGEWHAVFPSPGSSATAKR